MRQRRLARMFRFWTVAAAFFAATVAFPQSQYDNPHWNILLTDAAYSDFLIYTDGPFPPNALHEFISGEWGAAIGYDGIQSQLPFPQKTMWLEPSWEYPAWTTNSAFTVIDAGSFPVDTDGDGLPEGSSRIGNGDVEITITWDMMDTVTGTPMGVGTGSAVLSDRYVLLTTYAIKNVTTTTLTGVRFYQFLHGHPANDERPAVRAVYDSMAHAGALSSFRYDVTQFSTNSGMADGSPTGCTFQDHIAFSTEIAPTAFGLGHFREHLDRPATGLHVDVENDTLGNQTAFGPDEVAGATRINLGSIAPQGTQTVRVLLAVKSVDLSPGTVTATACARLQPGATDPVLRVDKGACGAASAGGPYDVITGNLGSLVDGGGFVLLGDAQCVANDLAQDRVTITTSLSGCVSGVFVLARRGANQQFDYGFGSGGQARFASLGCP